MNDLAIVCFSCDEDDEAWPTFKTLLDKYWPNHPTTYLLTETKKSPLMHTINYDYPLDKWTTRIIKSLNDIKENNIIFICDDCFLDDYVNLEKLEKCFKILKEDVAYINLELSFDPRDLDCEYVGFKKKAHNSSYRLSLLCGLWDKKRLIDVLSVKECSLWELEAGQNILNYDAYQVDKVKILSWFRDEPGMCGAKRYGRWALELPEFLKGEGIEMDLEKKGLNYDQRLFRNKKETIEVIVIDLCNEYEECIRTCLSGNGQNNNDNNIKFIIGTTSDHRLKSTSPLKKHIKKIIHFDKDSHYSMILAELFNHIGEGYVTIVDSGIKFMPRWDKELCSCIKQCGENAALTSWVWRAPKDKKDTTFNPYINAQKELNGFRNYLPILENKGSKAFLNIKHPYHTPFISNDFLFCHSKSIKSIKPDPNLSYKEQQYIYSIRLWTSGIDLYYPRLSYFYRTVDETQLENGKTNYEVVCALTGRVNQHSKRLEDNYQYTLGSSRPLWGWYDFIGYDYSDDPEIKPAMLFKNVA